MVAVEVLEQFLYVWGSQDMPVLAETPFELVLVEMFVTVVVHPAEHYPESADAMCAAS